MTSSQSVPCCVSKLLYFNMLVLCIFVILLTTQTRAHLLMETEKECGETKCEEFKYCDAHDHSCRDCKYICSPETPNFDSNKCQEGCQDYIHYKRYSANTSDLMNKVASLESDVKLLKIVSGVALGVAGLVLSLFIFIVIFYIHTFRLHRRGKTKPIELPTMFHSKYASTTIDQLSLPSGKTGSNNNPPTPVKSEPLPVSQRFRREPSESTLPDYAYDNASMTPIHGTHI